ncbi:OsmC family protein [Couchioplanes caeruleus]|uniref:Osmotically inducible protein OsmC n=2 Tax=Couchioplanes caeruleus TaxID=56438 RepID=A0A1K0FBQ4_9ACTN|nr:OsmC family protein [Couchioplanes caeruleus]OJF10168.1 osmotically inducible protein OsmC [Couchioplanes caeruleus subsp. caeruleus]ROP33059.1 organic hydroperoxide reductase OsmC/OhrA [Couchioplanes caeruleus]
MERLTHAARLEWDGSTGEGYRAYSRAHTGAAPPAEGSLRLSADPHFRGDAGLLNPEQLVVLAASSCQLLSFLSVAARKHVDVVRYTDDATGYLSEDLRHARIELIELNPVVHVAAGPDEDFVLRLVEQAHQECYIARSLISEVIVRATVRVTR